MRSIARPHRCTGAGLAFLLAALILGAPDSRAGIDLAVVPANIAVEPGEIFDVELTIPWAGSAFNAYDAVIGFDPDVLTFIQLSRAEQEGPLMTEACGNRFHVFEITPAGDTLKINHILLCAGVDVTGPGVVYRLRFQARDQTATTTISLLAGTAFYASGINLPPPFTYDAEVRIGPVSPVPQVPGALAVNLAAAPNPFNPATTISFEADADMTARVTVYSSRGALIARLLDDSVPAGRTAVVWNGRDENGRLVGSGVYLVQLQIAGDSYVKRVTLIK